MSKFWKKSLSVMVVAGLLMASECMTMASSGNNVIVNLPSSSSAYTYKYATRTTDYSYMLQHADSVYPTSGGTDTYTYYKTALFKMDTITQISDVYNVYETNTSSTMVYLREGTLSTSQFHIGLKNPYSGVYVSTVMDYDGL